MNIQTMRPDDNICGAIAIANALQIPVQDVLSRGWQGKFVGNDDDSIWHHEFALKNLGHGIDKLSLSDIMQCLHKPNKTCACLLANDEDPTSYHWFLLCAPNEKGVLVLDGVKPNKVQVKWSRIKSGWGVASAAYQINDIPQKIEWYKKLWVWITGVLNFKIWG